jgi:hypothetical protein
MDVHLSVADLKFRLQWLGELQVTHDLNVAAGLVQDSTARAQQFGFQGLNIYAEHQMRFWTSPVNWVSARISSNVNIIWSLC